MKRTWLFTLTLALFLFPTIASADTASADAHFEKGRYAEALKGYEKLLKRATGESRLRALYRAAESEVLLFRYAEAAQRLDRETAPASPVWKARLLLLRAEAGREYLKQYGRHVHSEVEEGSSDVTRLTSAQWHERIRRDYEALRELRAPLMAKPLAGEKEYVEIDNADTERIPTLWDFVVLRWSTYLLEEAGGDKATKPASDVFLQDTFAATKSGPSRAAQAAALFESAATGGGATRAVARELWRLERMLVPVRHADLVARPKDPKAQSVKAVSRLKAAIESFSTPRAKAEAAHQAAVLLDSLEEWAEAVALCRRVEKEWPGTPARGRCTDLRRGIESPQLSLDSRSAPRGTRDAVKLRTRNLSTVHLRVHPASVDELAALGGLRRDDDWSVLRQVPAATLTTLLGRKPLKSWSVQVSPAKPHAPAVTSADLPELEAGLYVVVAAMDESFSAAKGIVQGVLANVTRLMLVGSSGPPPHSVGMTGDDKLAGYQLYVIDGVTGEPASAVGLSARLRQDWRTTRRHELRTDADGRATLAVDTSGDNLQYQLDVLARRDKELAFWGRPHSLFGHMPDSARVFLDLDRPIYRPGQTVRYKVTAVQRAGDEWKVHPSKSTVTVEARDPNGKQLHRVELELGAMGSAAGSFSIPAGRLLGSYSLSAMLLAAPRAAHAHSSFSVEEYKRPEFELEVSEAKAGWKFGRPVTVEGRARYYFGGAVGGAKVSYRIEREPFVPWFCWFWRDLRLPGRAEVASGSLTADKDGRFRLEFLPQPHDADERDPVPASFVVHVEARDAGGRTIVAERTFLAGKSTALIDLNMAAGYFRPGDKIRARARLVGLDGQGVAGKVTYEIFSITERPKEDHGDADDGYEPVARHDRMDLDALFEKVPDGPRQTTGEIATKTDEPTELVAPALAPGLYRLVTKAQDSAGTPVRNSRVFLVYDQAAAPRLPLPYFTAAQQTNVVVGETARVLVGSADVRGPLFVEVWQGPVLRRVSKVPGGFHLLEIPITKAERGGLFVRWFGARDFRLRQGETALTVPWTDRELSLRIDAPAAVRPGDKARWKLEVKDAQGKPVDGEALVRVYDRSLEYYARGTASWATGLYPTSVPPSAQELSLQRLASGGLAAEENWLDKLLGIPAKFREAVEERELPALRVSRTRVYAYGGSRGLHLRAKNARGAVALESMQTMAGAPAAAADFDGAPKSAPSAPAAAEGGGARPAAPAPRKDFSETGHFDPQLRIADGKGSVAFRFPERLTSWRIEASVLTADTRHGSLQAEVATRQELMVRVETPRFFREGDTGVLQAIVHNETSQPMEGTVTLQVLKTDADILGSLTREPAAKPFRVGPGQHVAVGWRIVVPDGTSDWKVRAIARSSAFVDSEERDLLVLPARQRLVASAVVAMDGKVRMQLELPPAARRGSIESATLQLDPQLMLPVLRSLPLLLRVPYESTDTLVARAVPLSVVGELFRRHPALAKAAAKLPKRTTPTEAWDTQDPRRLTLLMETPWLQEAEGAPASYPTIDLFDERTVAREASRALDRLKELQLPNGAFPWIAGGKADPFLTLHVLEAFAELQAFGIGYPEDTARKAMSYCLAELATRLAPKESSVSLILYAGYVLTSFVDKPWAKQVPSVTRAWLDYASKHSRAMTPIGKAYAARAYHRLGDAAAANRLLDQALDGAREDEITGVYWAPEKISWLWYNDSLEKHAFFLRTLVALRPDDKRLPGIVKWLLWNRKGSQWKSTRSSAAAIYGIVEFLQARGSLEASETFRWQWAGETKSVTVAADAALSDPLRWTKTGGAGQKAVSESSNATLALATIDKEGPGLAYASLTAVFSTGLETEASGDLLKLERKLFLRIKERDTYRLRPLRSGDAVRVGDTIEVQHVLTARSAFEYVHLRSPRAAGFESEELHSGWRWDGLSRYEEPRDSLHNVFLSWVPHGEYVFRHRLRATTAGTYRFGSAVVQSVYAPEIAGHSTGFALTVRP